MFLKTPLLLEELLNFLLPALFLAGSDRSAGQPVGAAGFHAVCLRTPPGSHPPGAWSGWMLRGHSCSHSGQSGLHHARALKERSSVKHLCCWIDDALRPLMLAHWTVVYIMWSTSYQGGLHHVVYIMPGWSTLCQVDLHHARVIYIMPEWSASEWSASCQGF